MKRLLSFLAVPMAGSLALSAGEVAGRTDKPTACSAAMLSGGYALSGTGDFAGRPYKAVQTLSFDGAGTVSGKGTAVVDNPATLVVPFENRNGTYSLGMDCHGTMRWFGHHPTLPVTDHFHNADLVVGEGGRRISLIYTNTEFVDGIPAPVESLILSGGRM